MTRARCHNDPIVLVVQVVDYPIDSQNQIVFAPDNRQWRCTAIANRHELAFDEQVIVFVRCVQSVRSSQPCTTVAIIVCFVVVVVLVVVVCVGQHDAYGAQNRRSSGESYIFIIIIYLPMGKRQSPKDTI